MAPPLVNTAVASELYVLIAANGRVSPPKEEAAHRTATNVRALTPKQIAAISKNRLDPMVDPRCANDGANRSVHDVYFRALTFSRQRFDAAEHPPGAVLIRRRDHGARRMLSCAGTTSTTMFETESTMVRGNPVIS